MTLINDVIRNLGWEKASRMEKLIEGLIKLGIEPKNCFIDQDDNLIIPVKEIQRWKKNDNKNQK